VITDVNDEYGVDWKLRHKVFFFLFLYKNLNLGKISKKYFIIL
jgi:hypothetical protein